MRKFLALITSLKLTITCLIAAMILIFAGTLAQVHFGIHEVQQRYFQSWFVWWPTDSEGFRIPVFPGGHLIGAVLLINLVAAHWKRFRWAWSKLGIHLTHAGLIIMLAGGLFTDLFAVESHMQLAGGETRNYSEDSQKVELAVIDTAAPEFDQVTAIPGDASAPEARYRTPGSALPDRRAALLSEFAPANVEARLKPGRVRPPVRESAHRLRWRNFRASPVPMSAIPPAH